MKYFKLIPFFFIFIFLIIGSTKAAESNNKIALLNEKSDFQLYVPNNPFLDQSKVIIKDPDTLQLEHDEKISLVALHYIDPHDDSFILSITQHKAFNYKQKIDIVLIEPDGEVKEFVKEEEFKPNYNTGEKVTINGHEGRFEKLAGENSLGGILWWIEDDTYIEFHTQVLTKEELVQIATSMIQCTST
ncbi:DUF4367 domain-containing protein [Evansella cellulosilytica]|uniref:DUF4367 domain-containing protein n=1 Tax=Evansella cellulosilytica (strain ATCC 21833 / DSM 2522 / FERM P-1141 / JCM 9156 / N-4) TaxID=649639 RepID=E6TZN2_EVAC2|nr:DUF4367 domain-containing protein [Evansella cellulosilytica]ADU31338.1 hypothetical protein Bcell_3095 [Evansella cellulosilytica DSM 2522]